MFHTKFIVQVRVELDEEVRVVGNLPQMGNWVPENSLKCLQYDDEEWQSQKTISVSADLKFEFKLIKCKKNRYTAGYQCIIWEELPQNSNRKYKPQFHSKLFLVWSDPKGRVQKEKTSFKIHENMPGIIFGSMDVKQHIENHHQQESPKKTSLNKTGAFKKSFNPNTLASHDTDSEQENNNNSFGSFAMKKKSRDIRLSITKQQFEEIFLSWKIKQSKLEIKKWEESNLLKICFVCSKKVIYSEFIQGIFQQIMKLPKKYEMCLRFFVLGEGIEEVVLFKKEEKEVKRVEGLPNNYEIIFLNFDAFLEFLETHHHKNSEQQRKIFRCLYIQKNQFNRIQQAFKQPTSQKLSNNIELMCFNDPHTNLQLYKYFKKIHVFESKPENYETEFNPVKEIDLKIRKEVKLELLDIIEEIETIVSTEKWQMNFQEADEEVSEKQEKMCPDFYVYPENAGEMNKVKQSFTKGQIKQLTSTRNSMLIIDSHLYDIDPVFFSEIVPCEGQKSGRMGVIIAENIKDQENSHEYTEMIGQYNNREDICLILKNYERVLLSGTVHQPLNQCFQIIKILKYKASFYQKQYSGRIQFHPHSIKYTLSEEHAKNMELLNKMIQQTKRYIQSTPFANNGSFEIRTIEENSVQILWHFDKQIRVLKTLFKLKEIEDGDFNCETYLISASPYHQKLQALGNALKKSGIKRICILRFMGGKLTE